MDNTGDFYSLDMGSIPVRRAKIVNARVEKSVNSAALKAAGAGLAGSSPASRTKIGDSSETQHKPRSWYISKKQVT